MAKKVNKRSLKSVNSPLIIKKEKKNDKTLCKKITTETGFCTNKSLLSKSFSCIDGMRPFPIAVLAILFGFFNSYHQATMFENDRHFSHLSSLEREMTFRTEMGLYYFYYKRLTESISFTNGMFQIMNDNLTEYPTSINTLERFTLYPEVILAASYRSIMNIANFFNVSLKECWQVVRGDDLPPVESCIGIGDPAYFYVTTVFLLNGLVGSLMFLYGSILSHSLCGGILSALCFFFNHAEIVVYLNLALPIPVTHLLQNPQLTLVIYYLNISAIKIKVFSFQLCQCTRVQWTPPLRESFGYPLFLLQMMLVTLTLRCQITKLSHSVILSISTTLFILCWQFAQFALLTQVLVLCGLYLLNSISSSTFKCILKGHLISLVVSTFFLFGNRMLIASLYTSLLIICYIISSNEDLFKWLKIHYFGLLVIKAIVIVCGCLLIKLILSYCLNVKDDAHIWNLLKSKFTSYKDFHTMLYTCAIEFDFLPFETISELSKTLVLPVAVITVLTVFFLILRQGSIALLQENSDVLYNILQCIMFFIMASLVMRLKLFFTPHLCLIVSLTMCIKCFRFLIGNHMRCCIFVALIAAMSVQGTANLKHQRNIIGEFSNPDLEELISWINSSLPEDAVFAGPMPTMANILLSTRRPIVNHPHYENADLRNRTRNVYKIFSRKPVSEVYSTLQTMKVNYVILERNWCFGKRREGCAMVDLWDVEDPENKLNENVCQKLIRNPYPFRTLFRNSIYTILSL